MPLPLYVLYPPDHWLSTFRLQWWRATVLSWLSIADNAQLALNPAKLNNIIGVVKAYTTRVGSGPFPTEQLNEVGKTLRKSSSLNR